LEQAQRDAALARELYEKEESRAKELRNKEKEEAIRRDELIAKELFNKDRADEDAKKRKKDLEASDAALAKALKEKDDLEAEVERLRREAKTMTIVDSPFSITADQLPKYWVKKNKLLLLFLMMYILELKNITKLLLHFMQDFLKISMVINIVDIVVITDIKVLV